MTNGIKQKQYLQHLRSAPEEREHFKMPTTTPSPWSITKAKFGVCHVKVFRRTSQGEKTAWASCNLVRDPGKKCVPGIRCIQNHWRGGRAEVMTFGFVIMPPYLRSTGNCCCILKVQHETTVNGVQLLWIFMSIKLTCPLPQCKKQGLCSPATFQVLHFYPLLAESPLCLQP